MKCTVNSNYRTAMHVYLHNNTMTCCTPTILLEMTLLGSWISVQEETLAQRNREQWVEVEMDVM